ncbi:MAG: GerMN domain-containing protein [Brevinematia bacterium]
MAIGGTLYIVYDIYKNKVHNYFNQSITSDQPINKQEQIQYLNDKKEEIEETKEKQNDMIENQQQKNQYDNVRETNMKKTQESKIKTTKKIYFYRVKDDRLVLSYKELTMNSEDIYEIFKYVKTLKSSDTEISLVNANVKLIDYKIIDDTLVINLSKEIEENDYGSTGILYSIYQIAYTLGNAAKTKKVLVLIEGIKPKYIGGEGIVFQNPIEINKNYNLN